jgi:hypothetical protein
MYVVSACDTRGQELAWHNRTWLLLLLLLRLLLLLLLLLLFLCRPG